MQLITRGVAALAVLFVAAPLFAATFTVSTAADSGPGSLREAMLSANATPGVDRIVFAIGSGAQTIVLASALPAITDEVSIDGATQPGFSGPPLIALDGAAAAAANGLVITAANVTIESLAIHSFPGSGVYTEASGTTLFGNYIGVGLDGTTDRGNGNFGVICASCSDLLISGNGSTPGNVISGNGSTGVRTLSASNVNITGNNIGTNAAGNAALPNNIGLELIQSDGSVVSENTIGGNNRGVDIRLSSDVTFSNNHVGVGTNGVTPIPNLLQGVLVEGNDNDITGNLVANNSQGIVVINASAGNTLSQNLTYGGAFNIDLNDDGVTANDLVDVDAGPNALQNYPVLSSAMIAGLNVTISGTLNSTPLTTFTLELFSNTDCAGRPAARGYLGSTVVTTDALGNASFSATVALPVGHSGLTATATNQATRNTSELAGCIAAAAPASTLSFSSATYSVDETAGTVTLVVTRGGDASTAASVQYTTGNGTATAGEDYTASAGTLNWAAGDASPKTIAVPIIDDVAFETSETFTVTLSTPSGATLGGTTVATVTIASDDLAAAAAAVPTTSEWALILLAAALALFALRRL